MPRSRSAGCAVREGATTDGEGRRIILLGHGLGGRLAWQLAQQHPELVVRLVVISPPHPRVWRHHLNR